MPIVEAKCTNCGQTLKVDSNNDAAICEFCGSAFVVEKAINNFNTYNQYQIEHANIQMNDERSVEKRLENAEVFFKKLNQANKAKDLYLSVTEDAPGDYRGWWGLARILSNDFQYVNCSTALFNEITQYALLALQFVPSELSGEYTSIFESFKNEHVAFLAKENDEIIKLENELSDLYSRQAALRKELAEKNRSQDTLASFKSMFQMGVIILVFALGSCFFIHSQVLPWYRKYCVLAEIVFISLLGACIFALYKIAKNKRERFSSNLFMAITQNDNTIAQLNEKIDKKKRLI